MPEIPLLDRVCSPSEIVARSLTSAADLAGALPVGKRNSAFLVFREDFSIVHVSDLLHVMLQLPEQRDSSERRDLFTLLGRSGFLDDASVEAVLGPMRQTGPQTATLQVKTEARETPLDVLIRPTGDGQWIMAFENNDADEEFQAELLALTLNDSLTGISNRRYFQQTVKTWLAESARGAILLIDLDRFKNLNDSAGHEAGDQLLRKVGERLRMVVGEDHLLARLGGDVFAVWMEEAGSAEADRLSEEIVEMISRPFAIDRQEVSITASVGSAFAPADGRTFERLMKHADLALRSAKSAGRNCVRSFDPALELQAQVRHKLELDLREALARNQMVLHYCSRTDVESGKVQALDAVLRWQHPELGPLAPETFMTVADDPATATMLAQWMVERICQDAHAYGLPRVTVQLAPSLLRTASFDHVLWTVLNKCGVSADRLQIEVTEEALTRREEQILSTLERVRSLGVAVGITEFGRGDASLSRLTRFRFDHIRIAVMLAQPGEETFAAARAIATFGASLGISVSIDGVQDATQLERLRGSQGPALMGCQLGPALPVEAHVAFAH